MVSLLSGPEVNSYEYLRLTSSPSTVKVYSSTPLSSHRPIRVLGGAVSWKPIRQSPNSALTRIELSGSDGFSACVSSAVGSSAALDSVASGELSAPVGSSQAGWPPGSSWSKKRITPIVKAIAAITATSPSSTPRPRRRRGCSGSAALRNAVFPNCAVPIGAVGRGGDDDTSRSTVVRLGSGAACFGCSAPTLHS